MEIDNPPPGTQIGTPNFWKFVKKRPKASTSLLQRPRHTQDCIVIVFSYRLASKIILICVGQGTQIHKETSGIGCRLASPMLPGIFQRNCNELTPSDLQKTLISIVNTNEIVFRGFLISCRLRRNFSQFWGANWYTELIKI